MMNKKIKRKWLTVLRNGSYAQTRGTLVDEDGYCCLGVLCDIVNPNKWGYNERYNEWSHMKSAGLPSKTVYRISGLDKDLAGDLADMNDSGDTFEEIADRIEKDA